MKIWFYIHSKNKNKNIQIIVISTLSFLNITSSGEVVDWSELFEDHFFLLGIYFMCSQVIKVWKWNNFSIIQNSKYNSCVMQNRCNNITSKKRQICWLKRIHSMSGFSVKFECRAFPRLSTMAEVVMDDSTHKMAVMASNLVTSFLNISLACAAISD